MGRKHVYCKKTCEYCGGLADDEGFLYHVPGCGRPRNRAPLGWRCPVCGKGLAPDVKECSCSEERHLKSYLGRPYSEFEYPASYNFDTEAFDRFLKVVDEYKSRTTLSEVQE